MENPPAQPDKNRLGKLWEECTDVELIGEAEYRTGQGAIVEAMRRLRQSIERFSASSDRYSRRMLWLNIVLTVLTLIQVIAVYPVIKKWFE